MAKEGNILVECVAALLCDKFGRIRYKNAIPNGASNKDAERKAGQRHENGQGAQ